jgi:hypothetical protein
MYPYTDHWSNDNPHQGSVFHKLVVLPTLVPIDQLRSSSRCAAALVVVLHVRSSWWRAQAMVAMETWTSCTAANLSWISSWYRPGLASRKVEMDCRHSQEREVILCGDWIGHWPVRVGGQPLIQGQLRHAASQQSSHRLHIWARFYIKIWGLHCVTNVTHSHATHTSKKLPFSRTYAKGCNVPIVVDH